MPGLFNRPPYVSRRVDRAMFATAGIGAIVGLLVGLSHFWFLDLWLGAVVGGATGLALGLAWEKSRGGGSDVNWRHAAMAAIGSLVLVACAVLIIMPMTTSARDNVQTLTTLTPQSLQEIWVCKRYGDEALAVIDDRQALSAFAAAASDVKVQWHGQEGGQPIDTWWLTLQFADGRELRVEWQHRRAAPNLVYGEFIATTPTSLTNRGQFISADLREWFAKDVEPLLKRP